jgi:hypothetical protein
MVFMDPKWKKLVTARTGFHNKYPEQELLQEMKAQSLKTSDAPSQSYSNL